MTRKFFSAKTDSTRQRSYSNHTGWEITPLAATSHASKRTQDFPLKLSVVLSVCFSKAPVPVRSIRLRCTCFPSPMMSSTKAIGNVQLSPTSSSARPDASSFKVWPDCFPPIVKRGISTSPVEIKKAPSRNAFRTDSQPSSKRGMRSRRK